MVEILKFLAICGAGGRGTSGAPRADDVTPLHRRDGTASRGSWLRTDNAEHGNGILCGRPVPPERRDVPGRRRYTAETQAELHRLRRLRKEAKAIGYELIKHEDVA